MRGAVGPRVLAVAAACAAALVALGGIATLAVWGFREGPDRSVTSAAGWLLLVWLTVLLALVLVAVVALVGARSLRRPLLGLSRAAKRLRVERLPAALRAIEAGGEPAPAAPLESDAPSELREVAGAVDDLERLVYHHAKRARRAEHDIGGFLAGAADRLKARARIAEQIGRAHV